jgi:hypothetical protein
MTNMTNGLQLGYSLTLRSAIAGLSAFASRVKDVIRSAVAAQNETIPYGTGVVLDAGGGVRNVRATTATLTFSGVLITANVVGLNVVINGVLTALTATTFATDHATTMAAIATKIAAVSGVASATVSGNTIIVVGNANTDVRLTGITVTGGSTQATATVPYTSADTFKGIVMADPTRVSGAGFVQYDEVAYAERTMGVWVPVSENVVAGDAALLDLASATLGQFKKTAGSTLATGGKFLNAGTSGGLAILVLNLP